jgi:hypothetical protein
MRFAFETVIWGRRLDDLEFVLHVIASCSYQGVEFAQSPDEIFVRDADAPGGVRNVRDIEELLRPSLICGGCARTADETKCAEAHWWPLRRPAQSKTGCRQRTLNRKDIRRPLHIPNLLEVQSCRRQKGDSAL